MGYPVNEAELLVEQDKAKLGGLKEIELLRENKNAVTMTKDEQEKLMMKMKAFAQKDFDPEISANYMDFSKPIDR